jgi:hypothetical protein
MMRTVGPRLAAAAAAGVMLLAACRAESPAPATAGLADEASPADLVALVQEMMPRIERLSGLDRIDTLRLRRQDRAAASRYVADRLATELPPARLEGIRRTYIALGLLPDTLDLRALLLELYTEQVLGYYDPASGTLFILEGEDAESLRPVLAHELVHALQDQHTNLDSLVAPARGNDRQTAAHAAMEGHAMIVMFAVLAELTTGRRLDPVALPNPADELGPALAAQNEQFPVFRRAPRVVRETLLFPYLHGSDFVYRVWRSMPGGDRYPAPLDTLLPQSTAQVLHPVERFIRAREEPVEPRFDDAPAGWRVLYENSLGQLETSIYLAEHLGETARASAYGWAGDRYALLSDAAGHDVLHWVSVWETAADADRFAAAAQAAAVARARRISVAREDAAGHAVVRIVDAPAALDPATLGVPAYRLVTADR